MIKKRILVIALAVSVVGSASVVAFASQNSVNSTKNTVITVSSKNKDNAQSKAQDNISNQKAIEIATKAMKDYMGKDSGYFTATKVYRSEDEIKQKNISKLQSNPIVTVWFIPAKYDSNKLCSNFVDIKEKTGEVVNVTAIDGVDKNYTSNISDSKIKDAVSGFFKKINKAVDINTITIDKNIDFGRVNVTCKLEDGRESKVEINLADYSIIHYEVNYYSNCSKLQVK